MTLISMLYFSFTLGLFFTFLMMCGGLVEWHTLEVTLVEYSASLSPKECSFLLALLMIFSVILVFSSFYLNQDVNYNWFVLMLLLFLFSMVLLVLSYNMWVLFLAWDGLGVTSFFLVLYYMSWESVNGAMITVMTNRLGDYTLFWFIAGAFASLQYFLSYYVLSLGVVLLVVTSFTKSAQYPFAAWLPRAMAAPTPVSALVHSSTLVTAGVFLVLKFSCYVFYYHSASVLLLVGLCTMLLASGSALVEMDVKKVVALSTLSQMGFLFVTLGLGLNFYTFIHLIAHAMFKSCLFLQLGFIMHSNYGQQDSRGYFNSGSFLLVQVQTVVCLLCLCGLIFTSGFVSKDLILELFLTSSVGVLYMFGFIFSVFMTFLYSFRLCNMFLSLGVSTTKYTIKSIVFQCVCGVLVLTSVVLLWWANINLYCCPISFSFMDKAVPLGLVLLGVLFFNSKLIMRMHMAYSLFYANNLVLVAQKSYVSLKLSETTLVLVSRNTYSLLNYISKLSNFYLHYYSTSMLVACVCLVSLLFLY